MAWQVAVKAAVKAAAKKAVQTVTTKAGAKAAVKGAAKKVGSYIANSAKDKVVSNVGGSKATSAISNASDTINSLGSGVVGRFLGTQPSNGSSNLDVSALLAANTDTTDTNPIQMEDSGQAVDPQTNATLDALSAQAAATPAPATEQSRLQKTGDIMGSIIKGAIVAKKPAMGKAFEFYESRQNKRAVDEMKDRFALEVQTNAKDDKTGELIANAVQGIRAKDTNEFASTANAIKSYFTDKAEEATKVKLAELSKPVVDADLSEASLEDALISIMGMQNDRGLLISVMPKSLHIPRQEWFNAQRILKSVYTPGSANNDINVLNATNAFPGGAVLNHYFTSPHAWFIRTNVQRGMVHYERTAISFDQDNDFDTMNAKAKGYERYSFGWTDARALYGSMGA